MMFWGFILLFLLFVAIAWVAFLLKRDRDRWEIELLYLTRHEQQHERLNLEALQNQDLSLWARVQKFYLQFKQQKQESKKAQPQKKQTQKATETAASTWQAEEDEHDQSENLDDLPIFAQMQAKQEQVSTKPTSSKESQKSNNTIWNSPYFEHENQPSVLSNPDESLAVITLADTRHGKKNEENDLPVIDKLDLPPRSMVEPPSKKLSQAVEENLEVIELEDIRANLLRQRRVRRQAADLSKTQSAQVIQPQIIEQDEILANLVNTDSPANRLQYQIKRETVRESIIPEGARMAEGQPRLFHHDKKVISTRFTPYKNTANTKVQQSFVRRLNREENLEKKDNSPPEVQATHNWRGEFNPVRQELFAPHAENISNREWQSLHQANGTEADLILDQDFSAELPSEVENPFTFDVDEAEKKTAQFGSPLIETTPFRQPEEISEKHVTIPFRQPEEISEKHVTTPFRQPEAISEKHVTTPFRQPEGYANHPYNQLDYVLPDLSLLLPKTSNPDACLSDEEMLQNGILIEEKLQEFRVKVSVVDAYVGPVITRYEIEPDVGVRGNQVINLEKDLARALGCASIRIVETIPGKTCMGLELPNPQRQMIRLSEILSTDEFRHASSPLTVALGHDISGKAVMTNLAKAPHLLVAGTTGSGKSVGVNAMIVSILFKATPEEVRMIMIDPKMLELSVYEGIPHLLAPVVTDMKLAANALIWCVNEMEKRYRLMSHAGVRNLAGFNQRIESAAAQGKTISNPFSLDATNPEPLEKLPYIVVVVDEFSDLMMSVGKKIEELIARLAQKARAAGIHLILATQRPSVDVITGLIKANIPTRIAFQVSSKIDSRTILDQMGAENLLGQGDMLFLPPGSGYPQRVHGAFVADEEVHRVAEYLKQLGEPNYVEDILTAGVGADDLFSNSNTQRNNDVEEDPMYDNAVSFVLQSRKASISAVQRHLRIGYNRAARIIEHMEETGLLSAPEGNGTRTVLVPEQ